MAFTSWAQVREDLKAAIADYATSGKFMLREYQMGDFRRSISSIDEAKKFFALTYELEAMENAGASASCVSYGRHRRFR